uniref:Uncharacterized protein n=1 Tax=Panagrolaimus sp. PS1159 TaxID=55785 RepID=A0AC35FRD9_9BILA
MEAEKEMSKESPETKEEFSNTVSRIVAERAKIDPNIAYDTFKEEILELFNSEDQFSTFIACCTYMSETNEVMRELLRGTLSILNYVRHTPAYKLCLMLQALPIYRDDNDMNPEGSFYEDIIKNDPKEQQRNKKKSKKRKSKKNNLAEDEAEAATAAAGENDAITTEEIEEYIPMFEELLHDMNFSEIVVTEDLSPDLPQISPEDHNITEKAQRLCDIFTSEINEIVSVFSDTFIDKQIAFLNRELSYLQKKTATNVSIFEKRENEMKANIKEILAKTEAESKEQQKLEKEIQTLEAEIEKVEQQKDDIVKKIEKVDDNTFVKYKTQWQNTIKRFHDLEEEVKNVSCTIRREKQSYSDLSNAAKKDDEALKKEIELLEAAVQRKQTQLGAYEAKLESENQKYEDEKQKLLKNVQTSEMLMLKSMYDKEKLNLGRNYTKAQENVSCYQKALEREDDPIRRGILQKNFEQWEIYKRQIHSTKQILDAMLIDKAEQLKRGAGNNIMEICQFNLPQFHASATPLNDLILPKRSTPTPIMPPPMFSQSSGYVVPSFPQSKQPPPHLLPPLQKSAQQQLQEHLQQQTPQRFHYQPNFSGQFYAVPVPYNPPTASQSDHAAYSTTSTQNMVLSSPQNISGRDRNNYLLDVNSPQGKRERLEIKSTSSHSAPVLGNRWPIGVVPPNYVIQNDKQQLQQHLIQQNMYSSGTSTNDNTNTYQEISSRQNSNESIRDGDGTAAAKIPIRTDQRISGKYPIGVIPPYYVTNVTQTGNSWTPPAKKEAVFKFPSRNGSEEN